jgi:hypothetical protein
MRALYLTIRAFSKDGLDFPRPVFCAAFTPLEFVTGYIEWGAKT